MSTDLIAELRAALDAVATAAQGAADYDDGAAHDVDGPPGTWVLLADRETFGAGYPGGMIGPRIGHTNSTVLGQHIVANHPAFVLADIAAKRKLIERGGPFCTSGCDEPGGEPMDPDTNWTTPLEHHLDCGAYEAARLLAEPYGVRRENSRD
jgi:hypothetical protein